MSGFDKAAPRWLDYVAFVVESGVVLAILVRIVGCLKEVCHGG